MKYTRLLTGIIESYSHKLSDLDFESLKRHIESKVNEYQLLLTRTSSGAARGRLVHSLVEKEISAAAHIRVSCAKGCGTCCHFEVDITGDDAEVLVDAIEGGVNIDLARLRGIATRDRKDEIWQKGPVPENRCVFLDDSYSCRVYESRPTSCRKHAVTSPAELCKQIESTNMSVRMIPMVEVIQSATLNLDDSVYGSFAKMLVAKLDERKFFTEEIPGAIQQTQSQVTAVNHRIEPDMTMAPLDI